MQKENAFEANITPAPELGVGWLSVKTSVGHINLKWENLFNFDRSHLLSRVISLLKSNNLIGEDFVSQKKADFETTVAAKKILNDYHSNKIDAYKYGAAKSVAFHFYIMKFLLGPKFSRRALAVILKEYHFSQPPAVRRLASFSVGGSGLGVNVKQLEQAQKHKEKVAITLNDGLENILPLVIYHGKTADELKKIYGNFIWKKLAKQSFAANLRVVSLSSMLGSKQAPGDLLQDFLKLSAWQQNEFNRINSFNSNKEIPEVIITASLRKFAHLFSNYTHSKYKSEQKGYGLDVAHWHKYEQLLFDSFRLIQIMNDRDNGARQLKTPISFKKATKYHDELVCDNNQQVVGLLSDQPFFRPGLLDIECQVQGYTFLLLNSERRLYAEGVEMHHCIHSYKDDCKKNSHACFKITGPERASVAFSLDTLLSKPIADLRLKYNSQPDSKLFEVCVVFAKKLANQIAKNTV